MGSGDKKNKAAKAVEEVMGKYKKKMKKYCCCGLVWLLLGILSIVVGIALLVYFSKYWGNSEEWRRGLAYFGVALLIASLFMLAVGVILFVILCVLYRKLNRSEGGNTPIFKPPSYPQGEAPYPQQPHMPVGSPDQSPSKQPLAPNAPQQSSAPPAGTGDVHVEIADNNSKF